MADEPTASIPEDLADDVPTDVDFTAIMARAQAHLILVTGMAYQANQDLKEKVDALSAKEAPA